MAYQNMAKYLAPYACTIPKTLDERRALQTKLFEIIRGDASEAAKEWARTQLLCQNIKLILEIALGVAAKARSVVDVRDLMQVGQISLYKAMKSFDYTRGTMLMTFAHSGIGWAMERYLTDGMENEEPVYVPAHRSRQLNKVRYAMGDLAKEGRPVRDVQAILAKIHARKEKTSKQMTEADVIACLDLIQQSHTTKLNAPCDQGEGQSKQLVEMVPGDMPSPEEELLDLRAEQMVLLRNERILEALKMLAGQDQMTARDVEIFRTHYGLDGLEAWTLEESGAPFGLSRERARQVIVALLKKLSKVTGMTTAAVEEAVEVPSNVAPFETATAAVQKEAA